ncbi:unnamed protein product [Heterobilharzia americana]|nr:unnamed protein product [Heterobilharzia americana]
MYDVDYSMADDFKWGKDLGCDFLMKSCYEYIKIQKSRKKDIQPFCDTPNVKRCTNYENAYGFCSLYKYNQNLPHEYQYMDDMFNVSSNQREFYGGWDLMDYCPYLQMFGYSNKLTSVCRSETPKNIGMQSNKYLEDYGPDSVCFDHGIWLDRNQKGEITEHSKGCSCHKVSFDQIFSVLQQPSLAAETKQDHKDHWVGVTGCFK